jgi:hypothetical protein
MEIERIACHGDHRTRRKIHSLESVFPEDVPDVLAVIIGWINAAKPMTTEKT